MFRGILVQSYLGLFFFGSLYFEALVLFFFSIY